MIHSARPIAPQLAITILTWNLFFFAGCWDEDGRTDTTCENAVGPRLVGQFSDVSVRANFRI